MMLHPKMKCAPRREATSPGRLPVRSLIGRRGASPCKAGDFFQEWEGWQRRETFESRASTSFATPAELRWARIIP